MQDLKRRPLQDVASRAQEIWQEFLADGAPSSINLDSHSYERTSQNLKDPGRYSYEDAQVGWLSLRESSHWFLRARLLRTHTNTEPLHLIHFTQMTKVERGEKNG